MSRSLRRLAILDDHQGVARALGPWERLPAETEVTVFRDTLADPDALARRLAPFDALVVMRERTPLPAALLARLPNLRFVVTTGGRNRAIDLAACAARGITVSGTAGAGAPTVEIAWGLILALARHLPAETAAMRAGGWQTTVGSSLEGRTLGVVGLGTLGARVARVGQAFGMRVVAWSPNLTDAQAAGAGVERVGKDTLLAGSDVVTLHLVLSDRSRHTLGARELGLMRPGALLINTSRGPLVDEAALVAAVAAGRIRAGLDVYAQEPLPPDHPLRTLPGAVLTPHLGYVTEQNYRAWYGGAVEAVLAWLAGAPVRVLAPD